MKRKSTKSTKGASSFSDQELAVFAYKIVECDRTNPFSDRAIPAFAERVLEEKRTGIVLTGRVVDGKVKIDQSALDRIAEQFPGAETSFVAVNAPFDPKTQLV